MTSNINDVVDKDVKVGVDLDQALIISFIPVVSSPGLISDKLKVEAFIIRQFKMLSGALPAFCDAGYNAGLSQPVRKARPCRPNRSRSS